MQRKHTMPQVYMYVAKLLGAIWVDLLRFVVESKSPMANIQSMIWVIRSHYTTSEHDLDHQATRPCYPFRGLICRLLPSRKVQHIRTNIAIHIKHAQNGHILLTFTTLAHSITHNRQSLTLQNNTHYFVPEHYVTQFY